MVGVGGVVVGVVSVGAGMVSSSWCWWVFPVCVVGSIGVVVWGLVWHVCLVGRGAAVAPLRWVF